MKIADWSRQKRAALMCALGFPLGYLFLTVAQHGTARPGETLQYAVQLGAHLFAAACNLVYAWRGWHSSETRRRGWLMIGLTSLAQVTGGLIYFHYVSVQHVTAPFPGVDDAFFILVFPLLLGGVLALFGSMSHVGRMRLLLDSAIACSSLAALCWYFLAERIWQQSGLSLEGKLVGAAFPIGDVAALFGAIVLCNSLTTNRNLRRSLLFLAGGIVLWAIADIGYACSHLYGAFQVGSLTDLGWPLGSIFIGFSALIPYCQSSDLSIEGSKASRSLTFAAVPRLISTFMPYAASLGAFFTISLYDYFHGHHKISNETLLIGLFMLLLVLLRQIFTLLENRHLTSQLVALNETLEQRVARRTEQLSALLRVNTAVSNTLEVAEVLMVAGEQAQAAFQADAVVIWLLEEHEMGTGNPIQRTTMPLVQGQNVSPTLTAYLEQLAIHPLTEMLTLPGGDEEQAPRLLSSSSRDGQTLMREDSGGYCLRAPLLWHQKLRGMVGVIRWQTGFETAEAELLQNIGLQVTTALENARLYGAAVAAADCDPVTGLLNHRAMHQRLDKALEQGRVQAQPIAVMMLDLNNFKLFNDTYGHPVGDLVLRRVAEVLREEWAETASLGRYGGDEFIVVAPSMTVEAAIQTAERMRDTLMAEGFRRPNEDRVIPITLSFGIAAFPEDSDNRHELLTIADKNLYAAKSSGDGIGCSSAFQRTNRELRTEASFDVLDAMITAVDNKDRYTRQHSEDVTEYSLWIAEELGMSEETLRIVRIGGLLHDVGKIGIPDEILRKPGRLTDEEYDILKRHPHLGALIVGSIPGMEPMVDVVRSHHERWDGKGYPDGLLGEAIPLLGRIAAVADAVSAMTTHRPYRRGLDWEVAMEEVRKHAGTQFDPTLAQIFLRVARQRRAVLPVVLPASRPDLQATIQEQTASITRKAA